MVLISTPGVDYGLIGTDEMARKGGLTEFQFVGWIIGKDRVD